MSDSLELSKDEMHRRLIALEQEKAFLNTKIMDLRSQSDVLRQQLEQEHSRIQHLEDVLTEVLVLSLLVPKILK